MHILIELQTEQQVCRVSKEPLEIAKIDFFMGWIPFVMPTKVLQQ